MNKLYLYYHSCFYVLLIALTMEDAYKMIPNKYKTTAEGYLIPFQTAVDLIQDLGVNVVDAPRILIVNPVTEIKQK